MSSLRRTIGQIRRPTVNHIVAAIVITGILAVVLKNAWICDDAFITFRTIDNFLHGFGLRWNPDERVQTFTHPLWMMLITAVISITGEFYFTVIAVAVCLTGATLAVLFFCNSRTVLGTIAVAIALISSQAFIDYATSGLENPLANLLVVVFLTRYLSPMRNHRRRTLILTLIAATAAVNRPDHLLLYMPMVAVSCVGLSLKDTLYCLGIGFLPLVAWELFSLFYYGFPFPNTAYAKLNTGIESGELVAQGRRYFDYTERRDPITLVAVATGVVIGLAARGRRHIAAALGIVIYCLYILKIGGDFMAGRFFAFPLTAAAFLIIDGLNAHDTVWQRLTAVAVISVLGIYASMSAYHPIDTTASYRKRRLVHGIADERGFYFQVSGFVNVVTDTRAPFERDPYYLKAIEARLEAEEKLAKNRRHVVRSPNVGIFGFIAGPHVHIIDAYALVDPLLARLPAYRVDKWRIGHFRRFAPHGYRDSLKKGRNVIRDKNLAVYYKRLTTITQGDLLSAERLLTIIEMNLGMYDHLIDWTYYRNIDIAAEQQRENKRREKKKRRRKTQ